ncbi:hypothetical protein DIU31_023945 [Mucilaginibacter rubeus]|uniref:Uncharacterized protein n=1 Tax=Mucilaginibacter rubeus TaxID=2027860 RepID=A0AAE6JIU6_9SPHI|nr:MULTISPECIES: hypothetical protein [Mucilaginibacter]QEM06415.1 hypothetical protein DIU31_023945 [Mucilaginibacter rubeus]QEM18999.1 hypothetical protein DIU38_024175 [Mucilaginibacter gossypii]QTE44459.1 hypothetical protein J3L19_03530 [Mucilaginibacter rubeus]QTE51057.1 hypothetical protein J3L21_03505 [Mucilaginibacter rubeus]QTE56144.1 hypothetical protein J3L23_28755 [Mucilaginibacter rubeus]
MNKFEGLDILRKTDLTVEEIKGHPAFAKLEESQIADFLLTIKTITEIAFRCADISEKNLGKPPENGEI